MNEERIAALLLMIENDPPYGTQELIEQVLDSPVSQSQGKNFRYFTDVATKYHVMINDLFTQTPDMEFYLTTKVVVQFPILFGIAPRLEEIGHNSFNHYGRRGYLLAQWESQSIKPSSILKCCRCGSGYDLKLNAGLITKESHLRDIMELGGTAMSLQPASDWPPPEDTVMYVKDASKFDQELYCVVNYLQTNKPRRWRCQKCSFLQGYPGSFIRQTTACQTTKSVSSIAPDSVNENNTCGLLGDTVCVSILHKNLHEGEYAGVTLSLQLGQSGFGYVFVDRAGQSILAKYVKAVEEGAKKCLFSAGVSNAKVVLEKAVAHPAEPSPKAFETAANKAIIEALRQLEERKKGS